MSMRDLLGWACSAWMAGVCGCSGAEADPAPGKAEGTTEQGIQADGRGLEPTTETAFLKRDGIGAEARQWAVTVRWENDTFGGTDRFYTDGASLSVMHTGAGWLGFLADWLPWGSGRRCVGYDFGQVMITSGDKLMPVPDPKDRPYAGILFAGISLHVDEGNHYNGLKFITGVVGPLSFAEETQKEVHRWVGSDQPQGWDYQLHNESIFNLVYEHRRKYVLLGAQGGWCAEALPSGAVMLGNVLTQGQIGGQLRVGYRVPDDFGATLMRGMGHLPPARRATDPSENPRWGAYGYGGVHGNLVLHNITLDGNTWEDSRSVEKELLLPVAEVGLMLATGCWTTGFSYVFLGQEFEGQKDNAQFGAFTISRVF